MVGQRYSITSRHVGYLISKRMICLHKQDPVPLCNLSCDMGIDRYSISVQLTVSDPARTETTRGKQKIRYHTLYKLCMCFWRISFYVSPKYCKSHLANLLCQNSSYILVCVLNFLPIFFGVMLLRYEKSFALRIRPCCFAKNGARASALSVTIVLKYWLRLLAYSSSATRRST